MYTDTYIYMYAASAARTAQESRRAARVFRTKAGYIYIYMYVCICVYIYTYI